jgi:hypothetical protein
MAKKKGLAKYRSRKVNPALATDLGKMVLPGFVSYAANRLLSRIVYTVIQKKWPKLGKHAQALASVLEFGGTWLAVHKIDKLKPYHDAVLVGSAIGTIQTVVQTYVPRYGWIVSDTKPEDVKALPKNGQSLPAAQDDFDPEEEAVLARSHYPGEDGEDVDDLSDLEAELGLGSLGAGDDGGLTANYDMN